MSMTAQQALAPLLHEHQECIALSDELLRVATEGSEEDVAQAVSYIQQYNDAELEPHLQHEEQTIFRPLLQAHPEHLSLVVQLGKEHGVLRTLAETIADNNQRENLINFAELLKKHSMLEDEQVFSLIAQSFDPTQLALIEQFKPLAKQASTLAHNQPVKSSTHTHQTWLNAVSEHFKLHGLTGGHVVLFPRYQPDLIERLALHLNLNFFDYQKSVMEPLREQAEFIELSALSDILKQLSTQGGLVCHNIEALLCVKPEAERRAWLAEFLNTAWQHPVIVPLTIFQADVPENHPNICDLELIKIPRTMIQLPSQPPRLQA